MDSVVPEAGSSSCSSHSFSSHGVQYDVEAPPVVTTDSSPKENCHVNDKDVPVKEDAQLDAARKNGKGMTTEQARKKPQESNEVIDEEEVLPSLAFFDR